MRPQGNQRSGFPDRSRINETLVNNRKSCSRLYLYLPERNPLSNSRALWKYEYSREPIPNSAPFAEAKEPTREGLDMRRRLFGHESQQVSDSLYDLASILIDELVHLFTAFQERSLKLVLR
jgi:hypothetical protein